jgi:hypothetical protein
MTHTGHSGGSLIEPPMNAVFTLWWSETRVMLRQSAAKQ